MSSLFLSPCRLQSKDFPVKLLLGFLKVCPTQLLPSKLTGICLFLFMSFSLVILSYCLCPLLQRHQLMNVYSSLVIVLVLHVSDPYNTTGLAWELNIPKFCVRFNFFFLLKSWSCHILFRWVYQWWRHLWILCLPSILALTSSSYNMCYVALICVSCTANQFWYRYCQTV